MYKTQGARVFRIVMVDDNEADIFLLDEGLRLADVDYESTVINDGAEGLAFAKREGKYTNSPIPDLAVIDLNLPKHGGIEIIAAMRENKDLQNLPVVIITSSASFRERAEATELKVAAFITKPFQLIEFLAIGDVLKTVLLSGSRAL